MFLHQRVVAMKGDRVEIEIERDAPRQSQPRERIKPPVHQPRITLGPDPTAVLREEGSFRDHVQAGEHGQALVQHIGHDVAMAP